MNADLRASDYKDFRVLIASSGCLSGANIFDLLRRSLEVESKSKKTKAPPLQPAMTKKKPAKQRAKA